MKSSKLIEDFAQHLKAQNKSKSTIIAYTKDLKQLNQSLAKGIVDYTADDIRAFIEKIDLTPKTISRKLNSFRTFYKYLLQRGLLSSNPAMEVPHPKFKPSKPRVLSQLEYLALRQISNDNDRLYAMIELMLQTGIRIGEISRLTVGDVDIKKTKGYLNIVEFSTNPSRLIELNTSAIELLTNYIEKYHQQSKPTDPLFATRDGNHIIIRNIRSSIDRAIDKAGIENACVNDLRNTFIVYQLTKGLPIERVTEIVGHKSKATTARYLDIIPGEYHETTNSSRPFEL